MSLHGFVHIWLVGTPQQTITPFSMFQVGSELEKFPQGKNGYNPMKKIINLVERASGGGVGW